MATNNKPHNHNNRWWPKVWNSFLHAFLSRPPLNVAPPNKLTCQEFVELVTDYLESALLSDKVEQIEEHLADCPGCQAYLGQVRQSVGLLRHLSSQPVLPATKQELLQVFQNWKQL